MTEMEEYTPQIIKETDTRAYATMLVELVKCPLCGKWMIGTGDRIYGPFPKYFRISDKAQSKLAGWVQKGHRDYGIDKYICVECEQADKATFTCALCHQQKKSSEIEQSFGDPAEHLCKDCYSSVPAKEWDKRVSELEEEHQYDFG